MATVNAIAAVCESLCYLLNTTAEADKAELGFDEIEPQFLVFGPKDFMTQQNEETIKQGVSVFLYRVLPNLTQRTPPGRTLSNGKRQRSRLPLDLHLLLTAWGATADTQNRLLAWMMRTLEDYPTIPATVLNQSHPGTFAPEESVELVLGEMSGDEMLQLWDILNGEGNAYHVTIPYVARAIMVESRRIQPDGPAAQTFGFSMHTRKDES